MKALRGSGRLAAATTLTLRSARIRLRVSALCNNATNVRFTECAPDTPWPSTTAGTLASVPCLNSGGNMKRQCGSDNYWRAVDASTCTALPTQSCALGEMCLGSSICQVLVQSLPANKNKTRRQRRRRLCANVCLRISLKVKYASRARHTSVNHAPMERSAKAVRVCLLSY